MRLAECSKRHIPTVRASHLRWRRRAHMALHIGLEEEYAGVGKGKRSPCELKWMMSGSESWQGYSAGNVYTLLGAP